MASRFAHRRIGLALSLALALTLLWVASAIYEHGPSALYNDPTIPALTVGVIALTVLVRGWLDHRRDRARTWLWVSGLLLIAALAGARGAFHLRQREQWSKSTRTAVAAAGIVLRQLSVAEEDFAAAHGAYTSDVAVLRLTSPAWMAIDVTLTPARDGWRATLRDRTGTFHCEWSGGQPLSAVPGEPICDGSRPMAEADFAPMPTGLVRGAAASDATPVGATWSQFRHDAARSGRGDPVGDSAAPSWRVRIGGEFRSTPTLAGNLVVDGTHGSGVVVALDRNTGAVRWRSRAPNWIHNDAVVARGVVLYGFGNSNRGPELGFVGMPPSGIIAFDQATGRRRWTYYVKGSVMTSPVTDGSVVVFGTAGHEVVALDLLTGALRWRRGIGRRIVAMANPALVDSTVYIAQDANVVCAYAVATGDSRWCTIVSRSVRMVGHASPSVAGGHVYATGVRDSSLLELTLAGEWRWLRVLADSIRSGFRGVSRKGEQVVYALDQRTGRRRWETAVGAGHDPLGHSSGTPVVFGALAIVASPVASAVVALDTATGVERWRVPFASHVRGPPAIVNGRVIAADRAGDVHIIDADTGHQLCTAHLAAGFDRSGPAIGWGSAFFASLDGELIAVPLDALQRCEVSAPASPAAPPMITH